MSKIIKVLIILILIGIIAVGSIWVYSIYSKRLSENTSEEEIQNNIDSGKNVENLMTSIKTNDSSKLVILLFHEISQKKVEGINTITKEKFEETLKYLSQNQYKFLTAKEVYDFLENKQPIPESSIWLTFDDNLENIHKLGTPSLKKYGACATAFVEVMSLGNIHRLSDSDLKSMSKSGVWDIQSHGYNGHMTPLIDDKGNKVNFYFNRELIGDVYESDYNFKMRIKKDIQKSFDALQKEYNSARYFFAYPIDHSNSEDSDLAPLIESALDELNILGLGVKGNGKFQIDWSTPKHKYARLGMINDTNIQDILPQKSIEN